MRAALVVVEVALSVILLAGASLLIRSFHALANVDVGFRPEKVLVMETSVPSSDLESARRATRFYKTLLAEVAMLPGVAAAGATRTPPGHVASDGGYWIDHLPAPERGPYGDLRNRERGDAIQQAIDGLPWEYRELILLRHLGELPYEEIARLKQMPLGTVKNKLFRGRQMLKEKLHGFLSD